MKKISTTEGYQRFIGTIMEEGKNIFYPIKNMKDDYLDFFKVYETAIALASDYYHVEITLNDVPFNMKFSLVSYAINSVYGDRITEVFFERIFKLNLNSDSPILVQIKSDIIACIDLANLSCISQNFDWCHMILSHISKNFDKIEVEYYPKCIQLLSYLVGHLSITIQNKLYGDKEDCVNQEIQEFILSFMQFGSSPTEDTRVYKLLLAEYPKILKLYQEAFGILEHFQSIDLIIIL